MSEAWFDDGNANEDRMAFIGRSGLDDRVWVPTIDGLSVGESECCSSTSLRRVKAYVEFRCPDGGEWVRIEGPDGDTWEYR